MPADPLPLSPTTTPGEQRQSVLVDHDAAYRNYVADTIVEFATNGGVIERSEAYRQIMAVTRRTLTTVKNWLTYRANSPDIASLARIVLAWGIPPATVFPPKLQALLEGHATDAQSSDSSFSKEQSLETYDLIPIRSSSGSDRVRQALFQYTKNPDQVLFVKQEDSDNDQIRLGELMLVDPTFEEIRGNGHYLLRISREGSGAAQVCVRSVDLLVGEPTARLTKGSGSNQDGVELVRLSNGSLPPNITVIGRVLAVLSRLS